MFLPSVHSPDLTHLNFAYEVTQGIWFTRMRLKVLRSSRVKIEDTIQQIDIAVRCMVFRNLLKRSFSCPVGGGGHFEHFLRRKCHFFGSRCSHTRFLRTFFWRGGYPVKLFTQRSMSRICKSLKCTKGTQKETFLKWTDFRMLGWG